MQKQYNTSTEWYLGYSHFMNHVPMLEDFEVTEQYDNGFNDAMVDSIFQF